LEASRMAHLWKVVVKHELPGICRGSSAIYIDSENISGNRDAAKLSKSGSYVEAFQKRHMPRVAGFRSDLPGRLHDNTRSNEFSMASDSDVMA
jgi:hypothetical protein